MFTQFICPQAYFVRLEPLIWTTIELSRVIVISSVSRSLSMSLLIAVVKQTDGLRDL